MHIDFNNRKVVVTGATRGIGAAIANQLEEAGASLILTGTNADQINTLNKELAGQRKDNIRYEHVNFLEPDSLSRFIDTLSKEPKIDVCINNAGINILSPFEEITPDDFSATFDVNCTAPLRICQTLAPRMRKQNYGRIVNIASIWCVVTKPKRGSYTTAKSALVGLSRNLAVEMAQYNVLVNCVSPGFIRTELTDRNMSKNEQNELKEIIPSKRLGQPEEIARVVTFLASDANSYITAQNIVADGGFTYV